MEGTQLPFLDIEPKIPAMPKISFSICEWMKLKGEWRFLSFQPPAVNRNHRPLLLNCLNPYVAGPWPVKLAEIDRLPGAKPQQSGFNDHLDR